MIAFLLKVWYNNEGKRIVGEFMFGYIRTDTPYLYIKDQTLYRAMYCGLCKSISAVCGQTARMGLTYDLTFLSVLLHNLKGVDVQIEKDRCVTHLVGFKKPMAKVDEMSKQLAAVNTILAYYKYTDDIADEGKGRGKRLWFKKGYKRAKRAYPDLEKIVSENLAKQDGIEKANTSSLDISADATANMLAELSDVILEDKKSEFTHNLLYAIGKWIYLIDALDDYDKDVKKGCYNPFFSTYGAPCKEVLLKEHQKEIDYIFHAIFFDIRENLSHLTFRFNRDLTDNILLRGLPSETKRIMQKTEKGCKACKKKGKHKE